MTGPSSAALPKLTEQQAAFVRLLLRSPDRGDGWRTVSAFLLEQVRWQVAQNPELFQLEESPSSGPDASPARVRLTPRGRVVADYL